jgi:hypothetical protein
MQWARTIQRLGRRQASTSTRWRGIDIDMGYNPGVSALHMGAAQLCSIEDTAITGRAFFAGIAGLPGSKGYCANINVTGGEFGLVQDDYRPNPSLAGLVLVSNAQGGILVRPSRGPVVVSGFHIESPLAPSPSWRAVLLNGTGLPPSKDNSIACEDGAYFVHAAGAGAAPVGAVVESASGCVGALKNVFFSPGPGNATHVLSARLPRGDTPRQPPARGPSVGAFPLPGLYCLGGERVGGSAV